MIPVTKPYQPDRAYLNDLLNRVFDRNWLTNHGPLHNELEIKLKEYLNVPHLLYIANGTAALQIAIRALQLSGEVITTPFSYVATTTSLMWERCTPRFADIDPQTFNIDPSRIREQINQSTTAILATHVYGNPCDIDEIEKIAREHDLKVIYDAAHCFGVEYKSRSVFRFGDIACTSFHATKIFHTAEGGALFTESPELTKKLALLMNFGHTGPVTFQGFGINAKNSELHSAMGLAVLRDMDAVLSKRKEQSELYDELLANSGLQFQKIQPGTTRYNHAYYPVVFPSSDITERVKQELEANYIYPRRYFYPSLNTLEYVDEQSCPISEDVASRVLCLPMYHALSEEEQDMIVRIVLRTLRNA